MNGNLLRALLSQMNLQFHHIRTYAMASRQCSCDYSSKLHFQPMHRLLHGTAFAIPKNGTTKKSFPSAPLLKLETSSPQLATNVFQLFFPSLQRNMHAK